MNRVASTMDAMLESAQHHASLQREARETRDWNHVFTLVIFILFVGSLLFAIVVGTRSYRAIQSEVDSVNNRRLSLDLVANAIHANDTAGAIGVGVGPEGSSLVLTEQIESGSFETRFYLYEGNLVEEYAMAGTTYTPANATILAPTSIFEFSYNPANGLLTVITDEGSRDIALRSTQGGGTEVLPEPDDEDADDADATDEAAGSDGEGTSGADSDSDAEAAEASEAGANTETDGEEVADGDA